MHTFLRNTISKLCNAAWAPMAAAWDALAQRLRSVRETASLLYKKMMENIEYGRQRLKDIVEKEVEEEAKGQQQEEKVSTAAAKEQKQDDDEQYDTVAKIKLLQGGKRVVKGLFNHWKNNWGTRQLLRQSDF